MARQTISSGTAWEKIVGYSRAIKVGNYVHVAGTTATADGEIVGKDDPYAQTRHILKIIGEALAQADASLNDVVRSRIYVTDITHWEAIGKAHGEVFGNVRPAATMVEVNGLIHPDMLVEIEVDAFIG